MFLPWRWRFSAFAKDETTKKISAQTTETDDILSCVNDAVSRLGWCGGQNFKPISDFLIQANPGKEGRK